MKKLIFLAFLTIACAGRAASFVQQTDRRFLTAGDLDGDGRDDLIVVDASNATLRAGYRLSSGAYAWANPRPLGLDGLADVSCGYLFSTDRVAIVAVAPFANRINAYEASGATDPLLPTAIHAASIGPNHVAVLDIEGAGNTVHDDLYVGTSMNGYWPAYGSDVIRSDGSSFTLLRRSNAYYEFKRWSAVEYDAGKTGLAYVYLGNRLYVTRFANNSPASVGYRIFPAHATKGLRYAPSGLASAGVCFYAWYSGETNLWTSLLHTNASGYVFSAYVEHGLPYALADAFPFGEAGSNRLAVLSADGTQLHLYDVDLAAQTLAETQTLSPPAGESFSDIAPVSAEEFVAFSASAPDAPPTVAQYRLSGEGFVVVASQTLPAASSVSGAANVMTFEREPFVDPAPRRLQLLRAADWSDSAILGSIVSATAEDDSGIEYGLGNPHAVSLGAPAAGAAYGLVNQLHESVSVCSLDAARGEEVATVSVDPEPGEYATMLSVSFSSDPSGATIRYRTSPSGNWSVYAAPIDVFENTDFQYYAENLSGRKTIIRTASYRFEEPPSDLDSDEDGVPDYVELANGLDPIESGLDADGDGSSDLEELLAGTDPTATNVPPASRIETGALYDLVLTPRPYDGVANAEALCETGTAVRLYSASGGMAAYAQSTNLSLSVSVTNPAALLSGLSKDPELPFLLAGTDIRFDVPGAGTTNPLGVELVGIYLRPTSSLIRVSYDYAGGTLSTEASNWLAAARSAYAAVDREILVDDLDSDAVLAGLLVERKLADLLYARGASTNRWVSLFKGRSADGTMEGIDVSALRAISTNAPAYDLRAVVERIRSDEPGMNNLRELARQLYDVCSDLGRADANAGKYPLPVDVLRAFIYDATLQSNYAAQTTMSAAQLASATQEVDEVLNNVPARPWSTFSLVVRTNSFDAAYPVLYTASGVAKCLYDPSGNPYRFPSVFRLKAGAEVSLTAYTDRTWNRCPGTDPLEVIDLSLTALPVASPTDADGNLLPDDYEALFLAASGGTATSDLDGDGYCDLQEYLDGTDPADASEHGSGAIEDLSPPIISLVDDELSIGWPVRYAPAFRFEVEFVTNLVVGGFAPERELPKGDLSVTLDQAEAQRFYRVNVRLR